MSDWISNSPAGGWLLGGCIVLAFVIALVWLRRRQHGAQAREHGETLARRAEAQHETAQTRHEGGA